MSWSSRLLLPLLLALAACGFQPVYAPGGSGTRLQNQVLVSEPDDQRSYLVTRRIEERLGRAATPAYALDLVVSTREDGLAVDREGNTTRFNLLGRADYTLTEVATGRVVTSGFVDNFTGYSATGTTVATLASERDALIRLMTILADEIVQRLLVSDLS
ncbi:LPS assembly lipoprotein LptE [Sulfitobacter sp. D35]|uniref:LPS assembly lipoprotein LptE n=1 Tax=Sulfitobacter sp. D35 TaxID=3083252 RepID=UPI00296F0797|nr:LPS assembly lipoprotein LptE [Sulfitobacter sp. D35]MDW4498335.1 LPS assembly lipoprotein LptE [Sulfitobacter sp. D35]